ncbi:unnamed protein product [Parajaminaea phylloscopi]
MPALRRPLARAAKVASTRAPTASAARQKQPQTRRDKGTSTAGDSTGDDAAGGSPKYPRTPDGHYFVCRNRLWRCTNPALDEQQRQTLTKQLMDARREIGNLNRRKRAEEQDDGEVRRAAERAARARVQEAKEGLGERGPVWWQDGEVCDRKMVWNTSYKEWWEQRSSHDDSSSGT